MLLSTVAGRVGPLLVIGSLIACSALLATGTYLAFLAWLPPALGVPTAMRFRRFRNRVLDVEWERNAASIDEFGKGPGWLVDLFVIQGAAPTGGDRGMLWIEQSRLYFAGSRTSFGLASWQTQDVCHRRIPISGIRYALTVPLKTRTDLGEVAISFSPVVPAKWQNEGTVDEIHDAVHRWQRGKGKGKEGQIPPLDLGPGAPSRLALKLGAAFATLYWTLMVLVLLVLTFPYPLYAAPLLAIGLLVGYLAPMFTEPLMRWKALKDRNRNEEG